MEKNIKAKMRIKGVRQFTGKIKEHLLTKLILLAIIDFGAWRSFQFRNQLLKIMHMNFYFINFLKKTNNLYLKYFPINLYFNDENRGVYAVEESFSKELLERQKKRNGPIFSLNEDIGEYYPNVNYELYSI